MSYADYANGEIVARGEALYREMFKSRVENEHHGKFLVMDVESGDYEIADEDYDATMRILARRPNAVLYGVRIGYPAAYRLGWVAG